MDRAFFYFVFGANFNHKTSVMRTITCILAFLFGLHISAQEVEDLEAYQFKTWEEVQYSGSSRPSLANETSAKTGRIADDFVFLEELAPFYHGVASGDPMTDRVIIWTRLTTENEPVVFSVDWEVATDPEMSNVIQSGTAETTADQSFTVKVDVENLEPNSTYYYQFDYEGAKSLVGRTRTVPTEDVDQLRFAVVSCSNYQHGFFNAYGKIAERADLNAVLHLGDYIYEYGYDEDTIGRGHQPTTEILTLEDYRLRHSYYNLDPDLIRMQQQHPLICIWDDHETANNSWMDGAENHDAGEGDWDLRKAYGSQAYFEWMPIRESEPGNNSRIYRKIAYGEMADLLMLDTRLEGRDEQLPAEDTAGTNDPERSLLGEEQLNWLRDELSASNAKWKVLGNQVVFSPLNTLGLIANNDAWDGYPAERARIYNHLVDEGIDNVVILTGDIHVGIAADVTLLPDEDNYDPETGEGAQAVEFVAASVTSFNIDEINSADPEFLAQAALGLNIHGKFADLANHGYFILDLQEERAQADWYWMDDVRTRNEGETQLHSWYTDDGENFLQAGDSAAEPLTAGPALAGWPSDNVSNQVASQPVVLSSYPNPFSDLHQVSFVLGSDKNLLVSLVDLSGKMVLDIYDGQASAGVFNLKIDGNQLNPGVYILVIDDGNSKVNRKIVVGK